MDDLRRWLLAGLVLFAPNGYDDQVRALEADARRAGRGLWAC